MADCLLLLEEDLKWPNLNNNLSDDKRPIDIGKNSQMESPMDIMKIMSEQGK
jgi:hypothetical protein